jgi:hypothetical protein
VSSRPVWAAWLHSERSIVTNRAACDMQLGLGDPKPLQISENGTSWSQLKNNSPTRRVEEMGRRTQFPGKPFRFPERRSPRAQSQEELQP